MKINKYPDGSSYISLDIETGTNNPKLTFKVNDYSDLWYLRQTVDAINYNGGIPTIIIPNLIDAQADRRFDRNQSSGLKLVCNFLNQMKANFRIFHPHNPEVVEALMDNVEIIDNSEFINTVLSHIHTTISSDKMLRSWSNQNYKNTILMSSDAGGFKPLMKLCDKIEWRGETLSAAKSRKYKNGETTLKQSLPYYDLAGKDILIVDDISVYGGTFKGLSKLLKERNCGKLYLAVSHITVQNLGEDPVTNYFDKVFTTNSKFNMYYQNEGLKPFDKVYQPKNLEIIKLF